MAVAVRGAPLDDWIAEAVRLNPEVAAARARWQATRFAPAQAGGLDDPMFGVDFERNDSTDFDDYETAEWMLSQRLPWFGQRRAGAVSAEKTSEAAGFLYLEQIRATRANVIEAAWSLWLRQQEIELNRDHIRLVEGIEASARARYESGEGSQADVLRAAIELGRLTNQLAALEVSRQVSQTSLNNLLNAEVTTPRQVAELPLPIADLRPPDDYLRRARDFCCVLLSFARMVEAAESDVRAVQLESRPGFELRVEARQFEGDSSIVEYDTGVFMNLPWLWRGKYQAQIAEARERVELARSELEQEINMTLQETHENYRAADEALRALRLYEGSILPESEQLVRVTDAEYQSGRSTFLELIDAERAWVDARLSRHRAQADLGQALARLDQITGPYLEPELATGIVSETNNQSAVEQTP